MGVINEISDIVKEITGVNELEYEKKLYKETVDHYNKLVEEYNNQVYIYEKLANKINSEKEKCVELINLYGLIDKKNKSIEMEKIENIIEKHNFDMNKISSEPILPSLIAGGLLSYGLYTGVSIFGVASTGTAISTLSGAAATNATLACLGGGAIVAGGGGIAAGTTVLGIVAIIPVAYVAFKNFEKASQMREDREKINNSIKEIIWKKEYLKNLIPHQESFLRKIQEKKEKYNAEMKTILILANKITKNFVEELKNMNVTKEIDTTFKF